MQILYIFSKPGHYLSSVIESEKGSYLVKDCSAVLLSVVEVFQASGWQEIPRKLPFDFLKELRVFISSLNEVNASPYWWKLNFTDKNPLASKFHDWVFFFLRIVETFKDHDDSPVALITDDVYTIRQVKAWAKRAKITVIDRSRLDLKWMLKQWTPIGPFYAFVRTVIRHFHDILVLGLKKPGFAPDSNAIIFAPLINQASFKGGRYADQYFEPLLEYVTESRRTHCVFGLILEPYNSCVKQLRGLSQHNFITVNYLVSLADLIKCFFETLAHLYSPIVWEGENRFMGCDITFIIRDVIKEDLCSTKYFTNTVFYCSALRLFREVSPERFIYPFEAHPWERMMLTALKEASPRAKAVGFQHVSLTPRHLNLMFSEKEKAVLPFPDKIITLGDVTRDIILRNNPFLKNIIISGCALRQSSSRVVPLSRKSSGILTVAVIMASSLAEHIALIKLSNACASAEKGNYRFILRAHPCLNFEYAIQVAGGLADDCRRSEGQLSELLQQADIAIYTSSTGGIDALAAGKPVIYADVGDYANPDSLFDYKGRVFRIKDSQDFLKAVRFLKGMSEVEFSDMVIEGIEYASKYFCEITPDRLKIFLN